MDNLGPIDCAVCESDCEPVNCLTTAEGDSLYVCSRCAEILGDEPTESQVDRLIERYA